jgi:acetyl-CoA C-acetyltransferase
MKNLRKKIYITAGYNTISLGTGRKEFHPKKPRPGIEHYIDEAGKATLKMIGGGKNIDESVVGNFMAARFNKQAHLNAFFPMIDENLKYKPANRVESACASGGQALLSGIKSVLADTADAVLVLGVEVQNTVKAIYGADILAGAGWFQERKNGQSYFFPGQFSDRAGAYYEKFGQEKARKAFAKWFSNAVENARLCPTAQEFHNKVDDLEKLGMMTPNPKNFTEHLNVFDCSKVSDGASSLVVMSEEGLNRAGIDKKDCVEIVGWAQSEDDITKVPDDLTKLSTMKDAIDKALNNAGITINDVATAEVHDCFTIAGIMAVEALGLAAHGKGTDYVLEGNTARDGKFPINTTGGLIGWGHPTGATGVHMAVTLWEQLTGKAGDAQINIPNEKPYGLSVNMGGDDKTLVSFVYKKVE